MISRAPIAMSAPAHAAAYVAGRRVTAASWVNTASYTACAPPSRTPSMRRAVRAGSRTAVAATAQAATSVAVSTGVHAQASPRQRIDRGGRDQAEGCDCGAPVWYQSSDRDVGSKCETCALGQCGPPRHHHSRAEVSLANGGCGRNLL